MGFRIGVDVGGTFTDFLVAADDGEAHIYKTSTTSGNPAEGFFRGLEKAAADNSMDLSAFLPQVSTIVHGTTITTNTVLTGTGAITGFVTTHGFRDVLNMRRGLKERQFEKYAPPAPLVPRHLIQTIKERVTIDGTVMTPLDEDDVRAAAAYFREHNNASFVAVVETQRDGAVINTGYSSGGIKQASGSKLYGHDGLVAIDIPERGQPAMTGFTQKGLDIISRSNGVIGKPNQ